MVWSRSGIVNERSFSSQSFNVIFGPIHHAINIVEVFIELCRDGRNGDGLTQTFNVKRGILIHMVKESLHKLLTHDNLVLNDDTVRPVLAFDALCLADPVAAARGVIASASGLLFLPSVLQSSERA
jgi:hypothetical protein